MDDAKRDRIEHHFEERLQNKEQLAKFVDVAIQLLELAESCKDNPGFWDEELTYDMEGTLGVVKKKGKPITRQEFIDDWKLGDFIA